MGQRVIYVMTHDFDRPGRGRADPPAGRASGEPAGDPGSLRLSASRCDRDGRVLGARHRAARRPSLLALTRQNLPAVRVAIARRTCAPAAPTCWPRRPGRARSRCSRPARRCTWRSRRGSACQAEGTPVAVVSMPCFELFERQRDDLPRAGAGQGAAHRHRGGEPVRLDPLRRQRGRRRRHDRVRRSGSCQDLFEHFGITVDAMVARARAKLARSQAA